MSEWRETKVQGPLENGDGTTHLGNSHHRFPAYGQTPVHYSPLGCQASQPAAEPSSAGQWAQYGASPLSVSAGPGKPDGSERDRQDIGQTILASL